MMIKRSVSAQKLNPYMYGLLWVVASVQLLVYKDVMNGMIAINLAHAFDPFDVNQPLKERPLWQKIWLGVHLTIGIGLIIGLAVVKVNS